MSYLEAKEDGIRFVSSKYSSTTYYPLCHICGNEVSSMNYLRNVKYTCKDCKLEKELSDKVKIVNDNFEIKEKKFNNAVSRFKKLGVRQKNVRLPNEEECNKHKTDELSANYRKFLCTIKIQDYESQTRELYFF